MKQTVLLRVRRSPCVVFFVIVQKIKNILEYLLIHLSGNPSISEFIHKQASNLKFHYFASIY
jgi:hypothetical protein